MGLLTTWIHHSEIHFTAHWYTQTSALSILQLSLAVSWQRLLPRDFLQLHALWSSSHNRPCRTYNSTIPGGWPLRTNLLVFSSHPTENWTLTLTNQLLCVTSLNRIADDWLHLGLWDCDLWEDPPPQKKTPPSTTLLLLPWWLPRDRLDIVYVFTGRYQVTQIPCRDACLATVLQLIIQIKSGIQRPARLGLRMEIELLSSSNLGTSWRQALGRINQWKCVGCTYGIESWMVPSVGLNSMAMRQPQPHLKLYPDSQGEQ
jgi:hypothetical protein